MEENKKILVVDDDRGLQEVYKKILGPIASNEVIDEGKELFGQVLAQTKATNTIHYDLSITDSGEDGILAMEESIAQDQPFAVVFLDMLMPGLDGAETAQKLWALDHRLKIVIVTAFSNRSPEDIVTLVGREDLFFLRKPFTNEEIRQFARALTKQWSLERHQEKLAKDLEKLTQELSIWAAELDSRNQKLSLANEMGGILLTCNDYEDVYKVLNGFLHKIFANEAGILFVQEPGNKLLKHVAVWGNSSDQHDMVLSNDCWALKTGKLYDDEVSYADICKHKKNNIDKFCCIPLIAQGETLGVLHWYENPLQDNHVTCSTKGFIINVAEHLALSLANLKLRERLIQQSIYDSLTGLFNRHHLNDSLKLEIYRAQRQNQPLSLLMIDIDFFKKFNDTYGHEAGDIVLRKMGEFLLCNLRKTDIACRYGGEEFLVIMPATSLENVYDKAKKLREKIKSLKIVFEGKRLDMLTISIGIACMPEHGNNEKNLVKAADEALYRAKQQGRDRTVIGQAAHQ